MTNRIATVLETHLTASAALGLFLAAPSALTSTHDGKAPTLIQIFPAGPELATGDGRKFRLSDPQGFVERFNAAARPVLVDYDHLSHFAPDEGGNSKAAGWIQSLEARNGEIWAVVEWTAAATAAIEAREYRYISPEFDTHRTSGEVMNLRAAALVNRPAFEMTALARAKSSQPTGDNDMLKAIAKSLGLADDATEALILAAIAKRDGDHAAELAAVRNPKPDSFMPRADYDAVLARAETAENRLRSQAEEARRAEVETVITSAIAAGKIAPASKEHYVALASTEDGLAQVKSLVETLPPVIEPLNPQQHPGTSDKGLTSEQRELCRMMDIPEATFAAQLGTA